MNTKWLVGIIIALVIIVGGYALSKQGNNPSSETAGSKNAADTSNDAMADFGKAKKSAHYESNSPAHAAVLAALPVNVVIDFNFDLAAPSSITITKDGKEYGTGDTVIDTNKLTMRRNMATDAPDGTYKVAYRACWPDGSCHDGNFSFAIDRSKASSYENMQGKQEVTIRMSEIQFAPKNIIVSPGTKVTWVNDDSIEHFVNTDSHPAHTFYPPQNSRSLAKGASFTTTFDKPGAYPYHCSAHAATMVGIVVVQ